MSSLDSNIKSKSSNNTYLNIIEILFLISIFNFLYYLFQFLFGDLFIPHFTSKQFLLNCCKHWTINSARYPAVVAWRLTKRERSLIFSALKKSSFLKSMLLWIIQWFWVNVTTKARNVVRHGQKGISLKKS